MEEVLLFWSFRNCRNFLQENNSIHYFYCRTGRRFTRELFAADLDKDKATPVVWSSRSCPWALLSQGAVGVSPAAKGCVQHNAGTVLHCSGNCTWLWGEHWLWDVQWLLGFGWIVGFAGLWELLWVSSSFGCSELWHFCSLESRGSWNEYEAPSCTEQQNIEMAVYSVETK